MGVNWTKEQRQVIESRDRNLLVSAAAGSGKTAVLVERIIRMITDGERPGDIERLLVMTFTKAAASEMRERIHDAIEKKLKEKCDIPIFHDDQHGTAIITLAGLTNALKVVGKKKEYVHVVMNGAGAAAISIARLLLTAGFKNITLCDRKGAIYEGRPEGMNPVKDEMSKVTNLDKKAGSLADMLFSSDFLLADLFIGVSAPGAVSTEMVKTMNKDAIVFACANPIPEIFPDDAKAGGAKVVSTGRSDFPNQINNVLAFPGIFRGAFDVRAKEINDEMKLAASEALANLITDEELSPEYIIPKAFDKRVGPAVAKAVAEAAKRTGVARI